MKFAAALSALIAGIALLLARPAEASTESTVWSGYLDYAYVYSSADPKALGERLEGYSAEAKVSLGRYIAEYFETLAPVEEGDDESQTRRKAIAYLLDYLVRGDAAALDASVRSIRELGPRLERHENRYWYHYILAHRALDRGYPRDFVQEILDLWLGVIAPLEATYESLETLSLSDAPNSGFVAALPYLYENVARLVLLRSQERGLDRELDPLGAIVRLLHDGRVGAQPDVIPLEASSRAYLERIVERLDGPESDVGSLTFTIALFEATKHHERARSLLAKEGLSPETLAAIRRASAAYETALNRARTMQGECAVYTRVLRQIGELHAAHQRLGTDAEIELPFSIEGAITVYARLRSGLDDGGAELGYRGVPRQQYLDSMKRLWEEIQEASLNVADDYLARSSATPHRADEHSRNAARVYGRYLAFFYEFATEQGNEAVPDSAYFAAFEAAKGIGDALLAHAKEPTPAEIARGTERYRSALALFPFELELWPAVAAALGRHGRQSDYAELVRPIAERVARSRAVAEWIDAGQTNADVIATFRRALSDSQAVMYLGFGEGTDVGEHDRQLAELRSRRQALAAEVVDLTRQRDELRTRSDEPSPPAAPDDAEASAPGASEVAPTGLAEVARRLADAGTQLAKLDDQIAARSRALPLYKEALTSDSLARELRGRREHPLHTLLRRMYRESLHASRSGSPQDGGA